MTWRSLVFVAGLTLLSAGPALAQQKGHYDRPGPYVGIVGLGAFENFDVDGFNFSDGGGFNMRGGYRMIDRLAAEMMFEYVDGFDDQGVHLDAWNLMWSLKGYLLTDRWQPYGLFGMGIIEYNASGFGSSNDEDDFAVRLGGGLDFYLNDYLLLTTEIAWVKPTDDLDNFDYVTVGGGLQYRF